MLSRFLDFVVDNKLFDTTTRLLLAVSGGVDSVVLTDLCARSGFHFAIAHCNFNLRPGECDRDEAFVRQLADHYGVPFYVRRFDTRAYAELHRQSIEEAARELRYDFFYALMCEEGFHRLLTAHHRDDSAETFFLNLLRGTGIRGLHGIRPSAPVPVSQATLSSMGVPSLPLVVRPLLPFGRAEILAYADARGLDHVEDSTNGSLAFRRNRIRHQLLPLLRTINSSSDSAIAQTIAHLADVETIFHQAVEERRSCLFRQQPDGHLLVRISDLAGLVPLSTWIFELFRPFGFEADALCALIRQPLSGRKCFSSSHLLVTSRDEWEIVPLHESRLSGEAPQLLIEFLERETLDCLKVEKPSALFDADKVRFPLKQRHWKDGDRFQPFGMRGTKLLSDFFTDQKMSIPAKSAQWLLCDADDRILWVEGRRADGRFSVTRSTRRVLRVSIG